MTENIYVADFETTTKETDCRVWGWASVDLTTQQEFTRGLDIESFLEYIEKLEDGAIVYFHNLKFDGQFIMDKVCRMGWDRKYVPHRKRIANGKTINTHIEKLDALISDMGIWYGITIRYEDKKQRKGYKEIKIWNSILKIPLSVKRIAVAYNCTILKGDLDYHKEREIGYEPTEVEWDYIHNDCQIVAEALKQHYDLGMNKMTLSSDAMSIFKEMSKEEYGPDFFEAMFPNLPLEEYESFFKPAYRGGFTYANPLYQQKNIKKGIVYDVISMYPAVMYSEQLPVGCDYTIYTGTPKKDDTYYITTVQLGAFFLREGFPAIIQEPFSPDYIEYSEEGMTLTVTHKDLEMIKKCYMIESIEHIETISFKHTSNELFKTYIDKYIEQKDNSTGGVREIAKLLLNTLYGKFGTSPYKNRKITSLDKKTNKLSYDIQEETEGYVGYIPAAVFITSFARAKLVESIIANKERFIYCDTDSLHLTGHEPAAGIVIQKSLGDWEEEAKVVDAYYIRAKAYTYQSVTPDKKGNIPVRTIKCAGLPDNLKYEEYEDELGNIQKGCLINLEDFKIGMVLTGKLMPKTVAGGVVLVERNFTINL